MSEPEPLVDLVPADCPDADALLPRLAERLRSERRWFDLLEIRLIQARRRGGVPVDLPTLGDAPAAARPGLEADYSNACAEVGRGLLGEGRFRDAWFYLKTADDPGPMRDALAAAEPTEETVDELIEVALHEGADPARGYRWLLDHYGTCNGVTTLEGIGAHLPIDALAACGKVLVEHLYEELCQSLRVHIEQQEGGPATEQDLPSLIAERDWLFAHEAAHVDASHLSSAVRMARAVDDPGAIRKAFELAAYGRRIHPALRYPDAPPFDEIYESHALFFAALLGDRQEEATAYFRQRAENASPDTEGLAPLETLLVLLHRTDRSGEALREFARLAPDGAALSPYAPRPIDLARASGDWALFDEAMRRRRDVVALAMGAASRAE